MLVRVCQENYVLFHYNLALIVEEHQYTGMMISPLNIYKLKSGMFFVVSQHKLPLDRSEHKHF